MYINFKIFNISFNAQYTPIVRPKAMEYIENILLRVISVTPFVFCCIEIGAKANNLLR